MFYCENCNVGLDPDDEMLWKELDRVSERTGYDGVRDWVTETLTLKCETCGHVAEYSSYWVAEPERDQLNRQNRHFRNSEEKHHEVQKL